MTGRALVLGGGGVTGVAWELGLLAGLAAAGVDLTAADLIVGTSAGSVVAAQITAESLPELYERQLAGPGAETAARMGPRILGRWVWTMLSTRDPATVGVRLGRLATSASASASAVPEAERRAVIAARLPVHTWPDRRIVLTAVDAATGERVAFDRDSGVPLVDAVAASCAVPGVWPPVTIGGRRFIDGGVRSPANADLAAGCDPILIVAPVPRGYGPVPSVATQVAALRRHATVVTVSPDRAARAAIGRNVLDPARRAGAARAGWAQADTVLATVAAAWLS
jgi:NTE family protein